MGTLMHAVTMHPTRKPIILRYYTNMEVGKVHLHVHVHFCICIYNFVRFYVQRTSMHAEKLRPLATTFGQIKGSRENCSRSVEGYTPNTL